MRRARALALLLALSVSSGIAISVTQCAEPTQIILDIRTETSLCNEITRTGVVVTSVDKIDRDPLETFEGPGCEAPGDRIGTLTITPSGNKSDEVGIRVVAGIDRPADQCAPPYEGCIVARRKERFSPGESKVVIVILRRACISKDCGGLECNEGACVDPGTVLPDGGTVTDSGNDTSPPPPDAPVDPPDATPDALPDANPCNRCKGVCIGTTCTVDCNTVNCENPNDPPCGHGLDCTVDCDSNDCDGLLCATDGGCKINCKQGNACQNVTCRANTCAIHCNAMDACRTVLMSGGDAGLECDDDFDNACREVARCDAGRCVLQCDNVGQGTNCPTVRQCAQGSSCSGPWN